MAIMAVMRIPGPQTIWNFIALLWHRFVRDEALENAAALSYTTLLSLVPLMTVTLAIFSAFPVSERVSQEVQDFVFQNFVPTSGELVQSYLQEFAAKASHLTGVGSAFLLVVALLLMSNIDRSINSIWHVKKKRSPLNTFMVYWAILSLGPILMGISVALTSYIVSLPFFAGAAETVAIRSTLLAVLPLLVSVVAFTLLYLVVPNRRVPMRHAVAGGVVAAVLFEVAKRSFALYVTYFPTYEAIYGAMAMVPIFLIWLYLSWSVTLLGAEFTHCLGIYRDDWRVAHTEKGAYLIYAYQLTAALWRAQQRGDALSLPALARAVPGVPEDLLEDLLYCLEEAQVLLRTYDGRWALARDMSEFRLVDLYASAPFVLPRGSMLQTMHGQQGALASLLKETDETLHSVMDVPLESLFRRDHSPA
ncbi:MAG TPA: virulence factor BrkB family protein [Chromatiales bacterium]|nr:virulence factor BrkB family protein [Chromatiales bacterium]